MSDQRCGTCRWWELRSLKTDNARVVKFTDGDCSVPLPSGLPDSVRRRTTTEFMGTDCPCYERKEANERETTD